MSSDFSTHLNHIKGNICVDLESKKQAEIVYNSILLEFESVPEYRSKIAIELEKVLLKFLSYQKILHHLELR